MLPNCIIFRGEVFRYGKQNSRLQNGTLKSQLNALESAKKYVGYSCKQWNYKLGIDAIVNEEREEDFRKITASVPLDFVRMNRKPQFNQLTTFFRTLTWSAERCSRAVFVRSDLIFLQHMNLCSKVFDSFLLSALWKVSPNRINDVVLRVSDLNKMVEQYPIQLNTSKKQSLHYVCIYLKNCSMFYKQTRDSDPLKQRNNYYEFIGRGRASE